MLMLDPMRHNVLLDNSRRGRLNMPGSAAYNEAFAWLTEAGYIGTRSTVIEKGAWKMEVPEFYVTLKGELYLDQVKKDCEPC